MISPPRLIIFTRYPTAGQVKTRLIPAIGAAGAELIHRQMAEHAASQARALQRRLAISVTVCFDGGSLQQMQAWLGTDFDYQPQGDGDLGARMARAIESAIQAGCPQVIIIGTDCPGLTTNTLVQAFDRLLASDVVLGQAIDGGYYLIGLCRPQPELFVGIDWGTDRVASQTLEIAQRLNLSITDLPQLADLDRPEDLALWMQMPTGVKISIVIPTLNEAGTIGQVLASIHPCCHVEPIVVDGGSTDDTVKIAQAAGAQVISSSPNRAQQLNVGAKAATGQILLFLHGDTRLPLGFDTLIRETLQPLLMAQNQVPIAGAFALQIDDSRPSLRWIEWWANWRSRSWQMPYGDQGIFLTTAAFWHIGGFPELPIMEDFELIRRLQQQGKIETLPIPVITSPRRWLKRGVWQTTLLNQVIVVAYLFGISPTRLAAWYRRPIKHHHP